MNWHRLRELLASYAGQGTNLVVGAAMLPLILLFLDEAQFIIWTVFTALAGVMLQCEIAVQATLNRRIALIAAEEPSQLPRAYRFAQRKFWQFSVVATVFLLSVGWGYLWLAAPAGQTPVGMWAAYVAAFALSYAFGQNPAYLVGRERAAQLNLNNVISRVANFALLVPLLVLMADIWALILAFAISVVISVSLNQRSAGAILENDRNSFGGENARTSLDLLDLRASNFVSYALFLAVSFWIYRIFLLVIVALSDNLQQTATLALLLQLLALGMSVASVPILMRVAPIVNSLASGEKDGAGAEFARLHLLALCGLVAFAALLLALGYAPLERFGVSVAWPGPSLIIALSIALAVELSLQAVASVMVAAGRFDFVRSYCTSALGAIGIGSALHFAGVGLVSTILAMAAIQAVVAGGLIAHRVNAILPVRPRHYFAPFRA